VIEAVVSTVNPVLLVAALIGVVFGYAAGALRPGRPRAAALTVACLLPLILYSIVLATAPSGPHGWLGWWLVGLMFLFVPMVVWLLMVAIGYRVARARRRIARD
jgi:hypothetical protein